jgi:hypothetical protein
MTEEVHMGLNPVMKRVARRSKCSRCGEYILMNELVLRALYRNGGFYKHLSYHPSCWMDKMMEYGESLPLIDAKGKGGHGRPPILIDGQPITEEQKRARQAAIMKWKRYNDEVLASVNLPSREEWARGKRTEALKTLVSLGGLPSSKRYPHALESTLL